MSPYDILAGRFSPSETKTAKDTAWVTVEWEGASLKLGIDCTSEDHLTPADIGQMVEKCLVRALEKVSNECPVN